MHMNSAPHLLTEDRPEFERALDAALHSESTRAALADARNPLNTEQLRTMALSAAAPISACAAPEYESYVKAREGLSEQRREQRVAAVSGIGYAAAAPGVADGSGAGLFAIVAVLTPVLAGTAAVIFLVLGYALALGHSEPDIAAPLRQAGWVFAGVAACGIVVGMIGLLLTALRNDPTAQGDHPPDEPPQIAAAREIWRRALLERGLQPFLDAALAKAAGSAPPPPDRDNGDGNHRMPRLGYSRPDFTSPGPESSPEPGHRFTSPDFSSPDFSSPDYGGPDHAPN